MSGRSFDPFRVPAGRELDAHIHVHVLKQPATAEYPHYSTDAAAAALLRAHLEKAWNVSVIVGNTRIPHRPWFARYEIDAGNPTEALAETLALAICRLAVLRVKRV